MYSHANESESTNTMGFTPKSWVDPEGGGGSGGGGGGGGRTRGPDPPGKSQVAMGFLRKSGTDELHTALCEIQTLSGVPWQNFLDPHMKSIFQSPLQFGEIN